MGINLILDYYIKSTAAFNIHFKAFKSIYLLDTQYSLVFPATLLPKGKLDGENFFCCHNHTTGSNIDSLAYILVYRLKGPLSTTIMVYKCKQFTNHINIVYEHKSGLL